MKYAIPSMFSMFIAGSFCLIDTIFVGRGIGEIGLAALGLVWPIVFFFHAVGDMFGTGAAVLIAQALRCQGEAGLAAMMLISTLQTFGSLLLTGLAAGLQPIAAFLHGAQEHRRKRRIAQLTALLSLALGLILMLGSIALRQQMPAIVGLKGYSAN